MLEYCGVNKVLFNTTVAYENVNCAMTIVITLDDFVSVQYPNLCLASLMLCAGRRYVQQKQAWLCY